MHPRTVSVNRARIVRPRALSQRVSFALPALIARGVRPTRFRAAVALQAPSVVRDPSLMVVNCAPRAPSVREVRPCLLPVTLRQGRIAPRGQVL